MEPKASPIFKQINKCPHCRIWSQGDIEHIRDLKNETKQINKQTKTKQQQPTNPQTHKPQNNQTPTSTHTHQHLKPHNKTVMCRAWKALCCERKSLVTSAALHMVLCFDLRSQEAHVIFS